MTWIIYILCCADSSLYTGVTNNLDKRIAAHNAAKGAKYTLTRLPVQLVWSEVAASRSEALKREYEIKQLSRTEKLKLISS